MSIRRIWLIATLVLLPLGAPCVEKRLDFTAILKEVQVLNKVDNRFTVVIWMPEQYWRASFQSNDKLTEKAKDEFIDALRPYTLVAVVDAKVGVAGAFTFASSEDLSTNVTIEDGAGNLYTPLDSQAQSNSVRNLLQIMKPIMANAMGSFGSNFEILVFPANGKSGARIADATQEGSFTVHVSELKFRYRLPLGSLLPPMMDRHTGDSFPGNYHFNPFTGDKLAPADAAAKSN